MGISLEDCTTFPMNGSQMSLGHCSLDFTPPLSFLLQFSENNSQRPKIRLRIGLMLINIPRHLAHGRRNLCSLNSWPSAICGWHGRYENSFYLIP